MANSQYNSGGAKMRPLEPAAIFTDTYVVEGFEDTATGERGVLDLAYNSNTLVGQAVTSTHFCWPDDGTSALALSNTTYPTMDHINLRWPAKAWGDRNTVTVTVLAHLTGGTAEIRVKTSDDTTGQTSAILTDTFTDIDITVDNATAGTIEAIGISGKVSSGSETLTIISVRVHTKQLAAATALSSVDSRGTVPADTGQWAADEPLTVKGARELASTVRHAMGETHRVVRAYSWDPNGTASDNPMAADEWSWKRLDRFHYERGPGIGVLLLYAQAYTDSYSSGDGAGFRVTILGGGSATFNADQSSTTYGFTLSPDPWSTSAIPLILPPTGDRWEIVVEGRCEQTVTITAAGTGYSVGEKFWVTDSGTKETKAVYEVATVDGSGGITGLTKITSGANIDPSTATFGPSTSGGDIPAGSGATFNLATGTGYLEALSVIESTPEV